MNVMFCSVLFCDKVIHLILIYLEITIAADSLVINEKERLLFFKFLLDTAFFYSLLKLHQNNFLSDIGSRLCSNYYVINRVKCSHPRLLNTTSKRTACRPSWLLNNTSQRRHLMTSLKKSCSMLVIGGASIWWCFILFRGTA